MVEHEAEKLIVGIRNQIQSLQGLQQYLEGQGLWSEEDLRYCRGTLRRVARGLWALSRGPLGAIDLVVM